MIKWIGQHIWDFVSRFRNDVYLENIADGTVASDKFLGLDSNNKIVKETVSTTVTDLHTAGVDGADHQVLTDKGDGTIDSEANLTFNGSTLSVEADANTTANALFIDANSFTTGSAIKIDVDDAVADNGANFSIVNIDYDKSADNTSGTKEIRAIDINLDDDATSNTANTFLTGVDVDIDAANANGIAGQTGFRSNIQGGDTAYMHSFSSLVTDGGFDFHAQSSANTLDKFTISCGTNGATTLATTDADAALAHFEIEADGNITLDPVGTIALEADTAVTGELTTNSIRHAISGNDAGDYGPGAEILYGIATTSVSAGVIYGLRLGTWVAIDSDFESYIAPLIAVATAAAGSGDSSDGMLIKGCVTLASAYTAGTDQLGLPVYASLTGGEATLTQPTASGDFVKILGYSLAVSDKKMFFNPDSTWIELA